MILNPSFCLITATRERHIIYLGQARYGQISLVPKWENLVNYRDTDLIKLTPSKLEIPED
jgi:hypothetical protein